MFIAFNDRLKEKAEKIKGLNHIARAIQVAVAGKHNILLWGRGCNGKTTIVKNLIPTLTPHLTEEESKDVTCIHSIVGLTDYNKKIYSAPFRKPHFSYTIESMCGGGTNSMPGEISLAHNGVLFLDKASEFRTSVLQMLRVPIETGSITLVRGGKVTVYPARFQLVMATKPCSCGNYGNPNFPCLCSSRTMEMYWKKFSSPLLDRIAIRQYVEKKGEDTFDVDELRKGIINAYEIQRTSGVYNEHISIGDFQKVEVDNKGELILNKATDKYQLSPREVKNILKVALTIANMDKRKKVMKSDIEESITLHGQLPVKL